MAFHAEEIMNEEEKSIYSCYKSDEFSSEEDTCHKISAGSNRKSYRKSNNSPFVNKRVSNHSLKYSDLSYIKLMSYSYKKLNAKLKNYEKENEIFHQEQRRIQFALPTDEFNSSRFHSTQRIRVVQSSIIFNTQEIPSTSFSDEYAYSSTRFSDNRADTSTRFSDNCNFPNTSFSDNREDKIACFSDNCIFPRTSFCDNHTFSSTSFTNNRTFSNTSSSDDCADLNTSISNNCNFPSTSFSDIWAVPSTSFSDIRAFPSTSCYDDKVVQSKSFSDNKAIQSTSFSDGKVTSRASIKICYSTREECLAGKIPADLYNLFENLELETSSDKESIEVNVSDSSDYESMTETSLSSFLKCKKPAKESDSRINKCYGKRKKRGKTVKSLSNLKSLSPIQKFQAQRNSETVLTQTEKNKEDIFNEDYEKYQANRKRHISENECHSLGVFDLPYGFKKFKPL